MVTFCYCYVLDQRRKKELGGAARPGRPDLAVACQDSLIHFSNPPLGSDQPPMLRDPASSTAAFLPELTVTSSPRARAYSCLLLPFCSSLPGLQSPDLRSGFFLPTAGFLPLGSGKGSYRGYRGIPLNTVRIQISNQNR
jgi:hypothetical protein